MSKSRTYTTNSDTWDVAAWTIDQYAAGYGLERRRHQVAVSGLDGGTYSVHVLVDAASEEKVVAQDLEDDQLTEINVLGLRRIRISTKNTGSGAAPELVLSSQSVGW